MNVCFSTKIIDRSRPQAAARNVCLKSLHVDGVGHLASISRIGAACETNPGCMDVDEASPYICSLGALDV